MQWMLDCNTHALTTAESRTGLQAARRNTVMNVSGSATRR